MTKVHANKFIASTEIPNAFFSINYLTLLRRVMEDSLNDLKKKITR